MGHLLGTIRTAQEERQQVAVSAQARLPHLPDLDPLLLYNMVIVGRRRNRQAWGWLGDRTSPAPATLVQGRSCSPTHRAVQSDGLPACTSCSVPPWAAFCRAAACPDLDLTRFGKDLGVSVDTLYGWVQQQEVDSGQREGLTTAEREELSRLRRRECRRCWSRMRSRTLSIRRRMWSSGTRASKLTACSSRCWFCCLVPPTFSQDLLPE